MFPDPSRIPLKNYNLDHVFSDLVRDVDGRAVMAVKRKSQQLDLLFGSKYNMVVVFSPRLRAGAPQSANFTCFERLAGPRSTP